MKATADTSEARGNTNSRERVVDACRQAAHLSHEARWLKSVATDAIEDGVHAAERAITLAKRRVEKLADFKDETVHRVRRQPLRALGSALGAGLVLGVAVGWISRRGEPV